MGSPPSTPPPSYSGYHPFYFTASPRSTLTPAFILQPSIYSQPTTPGIRSPVHPPFLTHHLSSYEVLRTAARYFAEHTMIRIPPFRNENVETWRAVTIDGVPRHTSCSELLRITKPRSLESIRQIVDYGGSCRMELRFLNFTAALLFYTQFILNPKALENNEMLGVSWSHAPPLNPKVAKAVHEQQATRIVDVELLNDEQSSQLWSKLSEFGTIESLKPLTGTTACVYRVIYTTVEAAMKTLALEWDVVVSITFGQENKLYKLHQQAAMLYLSRSPYDPSNLNDISEQELEQALANQSLAAILVGLQYGEMNIGNRCICLSRLPPGTRLVEVCNTVRGGMIEEVKLVPEKRICFVTFLEPSAAAQFWATYQTMPFYINCERVRVGWGRNPGTLAPEIAAIADANVTRNVCIRFLPHQLKNPEENAATNEAELKRLFSPFGTIEQVRIAREVCCSFVTFTNIASAAPAVDWACKSSKFSKGSVQFGKDRCSALPRSVLRHPRKESILVQYLRQQLMLVLTQCSVYSPEATPFASPAMSLPCPLSIPVPNAIQPDIKNYSDEIFGGMLPME